MHCMYDITGKMFFFFCMYSGPGPTPQKHGGWPLSRIRPSLESVIVTVWQLPEQKRAPDRAGTGAFGRASDRNDKLVISFF